MSTIAPDQINTIAKGAAQANLGGKVVERVFSEPTVDSEGEAALRITIVIGRDTIDQISGEALLNTLVQVQSELQAKGEDRLAILEYATEDELHDVGD